MSGKLGRSGRKRKRTVAEQQLTGLCRDDRHPANGASPGGKAWAPGPDVLANFGPSGRALVDSLTEEFDLDTSDGLLATGAATAADQVAYWSARATKAKNGTDAAKASRLALSWSKHLSSALADLRARALKS